MWAKGRTQTYSWAPKFITNALSIFGHRDLNLTATTTVSMAAGTSIEAIDTGTVHRITSGQVVVDLQTAVKELVETTLVISPCTTFS